MNSRFRPDISTRETVQMEAAGSKWALQEQESARSSFYPYWLVTMNVIFGLLGLTLLLLLLPLLALLIYFDSPGPIFYVQERLGYKRLTFRMYKLRSMKHVQAGSVAQCVLTESHDPRVTRVGHLLRLSHLDELPQVINMLRGEMSLVGPRPELPEYATKWEAVLPTYGRRCDIKPGMTGWAQVMYHYGDTVYDEKIKLAYDLYYMKNQSFQLDLKIICKTVVEVVSGHGR